jgi:hypothetical protein
MEIDYIAEQTNLCRHKRSNLSDSLESFKVEIGFIGISQEELISSSLFLRDMCLKKYVLSAKTIDEMKKRNAQLEHIPPYSTSELVSIVANHESDKI